MRFEAFVFSYNRGRFLRNCLGSIFRNLPDVPVTVIDDGSTDPEVARVLDEYDSRLRVHVADSADNLYLGGLYRNMQHALETADEEVALFIQDDMQMVRAIDQADLDHWQRFFDQHPDAAQVYGCFIKRKQILKRHQQFVIDRSIPAYFRDPATSRRAHFSAVGLVHVGRLRQTGWEYRQSEGENNQQAGRLGLRMGLNPYPFMMWLPNAESAKFRSRGLLQRFAEWYARVGYYPYRDMTEQEVVQLRSRPLDEMPVAETLLHPQGFPAGREWLFEDATKAIRPLHRIMKRVKKRQVARFDSGRE